MQRDEGEGEIDYARENKRDKKRELNETRPRFCCQKYHTKIIISQVEKAPLQSVFLTNVKTQIMQTKPRSVIHNIK